ncbi:MAG: hypothetical protein LZF86_190643 [Nitrospira sp.]|nr:MAG: hypothetical protein LZF86_190643 [Nitrospira sp.]
MTYAQACRLAQFGRASRYRRSRAKDRSALRLWIRDLAHAWLRFGYQRIWALLRREGWLINRKRVRRLYRLDELLLRMQVRRRKHIGYSSDPCRCKEVPRHSTIKTRLNTLPYSRRCLKSR